MNFYKSLFFIMLFTNVLVSQNVLISQGGTVNVSGGETFLDAGGTNGNDGNTSYTITLMPPNGKSVCVDFTSFSSFDTLDIFDGNSVLSTNIGSLKGNYAVIYDAAGSPYNTGQQALGSVVQAELKPGIFCANNVTGALTFKFTNSSISQSSGWIGNISTFINSTSGCTIDINANKTSICPSQSIVLTATGTIGASALDNTFNTGVIGNGWNATPGGVSFINVLSCQPNNGYNTNKLDNTTFAWMQNVAAPRVLESNSFDVSNGGVVSFDFRAASDDNGGNGCEANDDKEGVYVQYSIDNGATWVNMKLMFPSVESNANASANIGAGTYVYSWNRTTLPIPLAAQTTNTRFRWYQHQSTTGSQDSWGIDDVKIIRNKPITLTITDLSTNIVLVNTTTNSTLSTTVAPLVTTNYRATISDGSTSCFEDITINVNSGSVTTIAYPSSTILNTITTTQNITVTNGPVTGNYTATPGGLSINGTTGAVVPSSSTPGFYTISVPTTCGTATTTLAITAAPCGSCASATCPIAGPYTNYSSATGAVHTSNCQTISPNIIGPNTYLSYYSVVASATGNIGAIISNDNTPNTCSTSRTAVLYLNSTNCNSSTTALIPVNGSNGSTFYNPEWTGLAPGTTYIMVVTTIVASGCEIQDQCVSYYQPTSALGCSTCATATCPTTSIITTTALLGQTGITTAINSAGDILGLTPLSPGQSATVCVPVTVVSNSIVLGFKQKFEASSGCANVSEQLITYQLRPASNCNATPIIPNRTNAANVGSGFNPEWDNLAPGNYVLCFTLNVTNTSLCNPVDLQGLGYYNVVPANVPCQDYQIQLYDDDATSMVHTGSTFSCTDPGVYLGPTADPTVYDSGLPYQNYNISITALTGTLNNLVLNRYDAGTNLLAEALTVTPGQIVQNYFLRPAPGQYYKLDKTNTNSGTYAYTIVDVISGATVATGTWTITAGAESAASITLIPQGTAAYSGPGVTNGYDVTGINNYTNDRGIGFFNPSLAGAGTHIITYTWNNGLAAPNNCTLTRTKTVIVTGPSAPTTANISICTGTSVTLTASAISTGAIVKWYDDSTGGNLLFTGNPFTTPTLTAATSYWVTQTTGGCESTRTQVTVSITPGTDATYMLTSTNCAPGSITFGSVSPVATTFDWVNGPSGYTFPSGFTTPSTTNTSLTNLPPGTYCVDITSPNVVGGTTTTTLLTENFESNAPNWTIDNTGGNNIFVINNSYIGGTCTIGGVPFSVPVVPNQGAWATSGPQSKYLHIKATNTCGFLCAESNFPPANANYCSTVSDQKFTLNTPLSTIGKTNVTVSFQYINKGTDVDDFGALEYSTNGGASWTQAGANLTGKTTWFNQVTTLPAWNNQPSLLFRFRWKNDASSSSDPPLCIDEIIVTAQETAVASCGSTKQECIVITAAPLVPTVTLTAATCLANGMASVSNYSSTETYTSTPTGLTVSSTGMISGFTCGTAYTLTATNSATCSATSTSFTVQCQLAAPLVPTVTLTAATCLANGTASVSNYSAALNYTSTPLGLTVSSTGVISGFTCGTAYTITATNSATCSATSTSFTVQCQLAAPLVPTVTLTAATCLANGTASVSNYSAALNYTSTPLGLTVSSTGVISGFTCGTAYTITATNSATCSATSTSFTAQCQLLAPLVPTITTTAASCSQSGISTISNYNAALTYIFSPSGPNVSSTGLISGMTVGLNYTVISSNGSCLSATSASFATAVQLVKPILNYTVTNPICDGNTLDFVLNSNIPGTTFVWSASNNELNGFIASGDQTNINQIVHLINPISTSGSISMIILPINNGCIGDPVAVTILVNPIPKITTITESDITLCSGQNVNINVIGEPSGTTYNWTAVNVNGVAISGGIYSGTTTGNLNFQLNTTSITAVGTIQFQIIPVRNGCFGTPVLSRVITVYPLPGNPIGLPHPAICSGESTNINVSENLLIAGTQLKWQVIDSNAVTGFISTGIAVAPISINHILLNNSDIQGYVTYRITSVLGNCEGAFVDIKVLVNPLPKPALIDGHICVNKTTGATFQGYVLDTQLSNPNFTYDWYLLNTTTNTYVALPSTNGPTYEATQPGTYKVVVTNTVTNCEQSDIASVVTVYPATGISAEVSEAFSDNATITITVNPIGTGNLIYSLDGGAWQVSNIFTNVLPGTHEVMVEDLEGCTNLAINVLVIDYPKYFTPNGDGINDTWNIIGLNQPDAKLFIFDRYGKLLKQLSTTGIGWDGTYIGAQLPSTDYWFTLDYSENGTQKQFKSHFSLKR